MIDEVNQVCSADARLSTLNTYRWPAAAQQRASAYPLSGMVLGGVAVAAQMLVRSARRRGQLTDAVMIGHDTRRHADERGGRTLETRFDHFQRACYHGASSTCDTGEREKRKETVSDIWWRVDEV